MKVCVQQFCLGIPGEVTAQTSKLPRPVLARVYRELHRQAHHLQAEGAHLKQEDAGIRAVMSQPFCITSERCGLFCNSLPGTGSWMFSGLNAFLTLGYDVVSDFNRHTVTGTNTDQGESGVVYEGPRLHGEEGQAKSKPESTCRSALHAAYASDANCLQAEGTP